MTGAAALCLALFAAGPTSLVLPGYRLHLVVSEELDPDYLGRLARPGVVLWVKTGSNLLKDSIAERLKRFPEAYVEVRPPVLEAHARAFARAPSAGPWIREEDLGGKGLYRFGSRRMAVKVSGELTAERFERLRRAKAARLRWSPSASQLTLESWGRLLQLPGSREVLPEPAQAIGCPAVAAPSSHSILIVRDTAPPAQPGGGPCAVGSIVRIRPGVSDDELARLYAADPAVELELTVQNELEASAARKLLDRLDQASPGPR